jgi:hypothetical protein
MLKKLVKKFARRYELAAKLVAAQFFGQVVEHQMMFNQNADT